MQETGIATVSICCKGSRAEFLGKFWHFNN